MAYVDVPKDLTNIKTKFVGNFTKRQCVCFGIGVLVGFPGYFCTLENILFLRYGEKTWKGDMDVTGKETPNKRSVQKFVRYAEGAKMYTMSSVRNVFIPANRAFGYQSCFVESIRKPNSEGRIIRNGKQRRLSDEQREVRNGHLVQ